MVSVPACSQVEEDHDPVLSATRLFTFAQNLIKASRKVRLTTGFVSKRIKHFGTESQLFRVGAVHV